MRVFFIYLFIFINFLFYCADAVQISLQKISLNRTSSVEEINSFTSNSFISFDFKCYENALIKLDQTKEFISVFLSGNDRKNVNNLHITFNNILKNKYICAINKMLSVKSHANISSYLSYVIYTRAP